MDCGINKPLSKLSVTDIPTIVRSVSLHAIILKVKAALDQFIDGLKESGKLFVKPLDSALNAGMQNDFSLISEACNPLLLQTVSLHCLRRKSFQNKDVLPI